MYLKFNIEIQRTNRMVTQQTIYPMVVGLHSNLINIFNKLRGHFERERERERELREKTGLLFDEMDIEKITFCVIEYSFSGTFFL